MWGLVWGWGGRNRRRAEPDRGRAQPLGASSSAHAHPVVTGGGQEASWHVQGRLWLREALPLP